MKLQLYLIGIFMLLGGIGYAQTDSDPKLSILGNWKLSKTYTKSDGTNYQDITFYNGLGYAEQIINVGASAVSNKNIVVPVTYDAGLRADAKKYLPYVSTNNTTVQDNSAVALQGSYYNTLFGTASGGYSYIEKTYEPSPLNRPTAQRNAGKVFRDNNKITTIGYATNIAGEVFKLDILGSNITVGTYPAATLYKNTVANEDNTSTITYTDMLGRTVLERISGAGINQDTYYGYDHYGRLSVVITPKGAESLTATTYTSSSALIKDYGYIYLYDGVGNLIEKKLPGCEIEYFIYDKGNRLVMKQDGNLRRENKWIYNVYDNINRLIETSIVQGTLSKDEIQSRYLDKWFKNIYPILGGTENVNKPFASTEFKVIKILSCSRYSNCTYLPHLNVSTRNVALSQGRYILLHLDQISQWGAFGYDSSGIYLLADDMVRSDYFICNDSSDPTINYYYIPEECISIMEDIVAMDPWAAYEFINYFPGSGSPLANVTITVESTESGQPFPPATFFTVPTYLSFIPIPNVATLADIDQNNSRSKKLYEEIAILDDNSRFIERAFYYDYLNRIIQSVEKNYLGGISRITYKYDLIGNILTKHERHQSSSGSSEDNKLTNYTYDLRCRLLSETTTVNNTSATITYGYNDLGQVIRKTYGSITETLAYNIQGWLTSQAATSNGSNIYSQQLRYYDAVKTPQSYTGNISEWSWQHQAKTQNTYGFTYDGFSRLANTSRYTGTAMTHNNTFVEQGITYDKNGNITTLQRYGSALLNNWTYTYSGNKLTNLSGSSAASYTYDNNGNITTDGRKNLQISYNVLNLPQTVSQGGTVLATYVYLADGTKAEVYTGSNRSTGTGYSYLGSLRYDKAGGSITLKNASFGGGQLIKTSGGIQPFYYTTDHLGSVRVITNSSGTVQEQNDYYPYGGKHTSGDSYYASLAGNQYKFNGKEEQTTGNLGYLDYGARMYDTELGRWSINDPLAEKYRSTSPYNYCLGNPVKFVDPDGKDVRVSFKGNIITVQANVIVFSRNGQINESVVENYKQQIMSAWAHDDNGNNWTYKDDKKEYSLNFDINVMAGNSNLANKKNRNYNGVNNYVEVIEGDDYSVKRSSVINSNTGIWKKETLAAGHEFGHFMGMDDRYTLSDNKKISIPDRDYNSNIMSVYGNKAEQKNINNFMKNVMNQKQPFNIPSYFNQLPIYINVKNREIK